LKRADAGVTLIRLTVGALKLQPAKYHIRGGQARYYWKPVAAMCTIIIRCGFVAPRMERGEICIQFKEKTAKSPL